MSNSPSTKSIISLDRKVMTCLQRDIIIYTVQLSRVDSRYLYLYLHSIKNLLYNYKKNIVISAISFMGTRKYHINLVYFI